MGESPYRQKIEVGIQQQRCTVFRREFFWIPFERIVVKLPVLEASDLRLHVTI